MPRRAAPHPLAFGLLFALLRAPPADGYNGAAARPQLAPTGRRDLLPALDDLPDLSLDARVRHHVGRVDVALGGRGANRRLHFDAVHRWAKRRLDAAARPPPVVVGIAGGSGSGKTELAKTLTAALGGEERVLHLSHDSYYRDIAHKSFAERAATNFDHPDSLETGLLVDHVRALRAAADGAATSIAVPAYDFATHARVAGAEAVHALGARDVVLVEVRENIPLPLSERSLSELQLRARRGHPALRARRAARAARHQALRRHARGRAARAPRRARRARARPARRRRRAPVGRGRAADARTVRRAEPRPSGMKLRPLSSLSGSSSRRGGTPT